MQWRSRMGTRWHFVASLIERYGRHEGVGVELGIKEGRFSTFLLESHPKLNMVGVDMDCPQPPQDRMGYETYDEWDWSAILEERAINLANVKDRFEFLQMDTVEASTHVEDGSVDFVFVDAEHTYHGVKRDIEAWLPKIKPGGILSGHDYNPNLPRFAELMQAVDEYGPIKTGPDAVWWKRV